MTTSDIEPTQRLLAAYVYAPEEKASGPTISVNQAVSRVAFFYERIRNAIEFKEEHLFRKNAVERILKRRSIIQLEKRDLARDLIVELIRGRYLPNNEVPESKITDVRAILDNYAALRKEIAVHVRGEERRRLRDWLLTIESVEIEKALISQHRNEAIVEFMYDRLQPHIEVADKSMTEDEKNIQVFIAAHRALLKSDDAVVRYYLWRLFVPEWEAPTEDTLIAVAGRIRIIRDTIEAQMTHAIGPRLTRTFKQFSIMFIVLKDVLDEAEEAAADLVNSPDVFEAHIRKAVAKRYAAARTKISRTVVRSIIYILITKMVLGLAIEFPYDLLYAKQVDWLPLGVNVLFHPFLLFMIAMTVRVPSEKNTKTIIASLDAFIQGEVTQGMLEPIRKPVARRRMTAIFSFIYLITYVITFGLIIWGLRFLGFNIVSMTIFILFLSIVSFFGLKVRGIARELVVVRKRENVLTTLVDFFAVPILHLGRWISEKAPKINVLIFILDFILEAPFKTFIDIIEQWFAFIREKREEMY